MRPKHIYKLTAILLLICFSLTFSGCSTLKKSEYEQYGYHGTPVVKEGMRILPLDWLGNLIGSLAKLLIFNWKVERHKITEPTETAIDQFIQSHPELGGLAIQLNRYAPQDAMKRLFSNKGVKWPYRYTIGFITVLIVDVILINRIFGGDHYNPFTHTVNLYSDLPSIALHELGHAEDFAKRRYRGSYALTRILPFVDLRQEYLATSATIEYARNEKLYPLELESYRVLYPAYGTYIGGYMGILSLFAVIGGHVVGRRAAAERQDELEAQGLI